jgi:hypothetical protein
LPPDVRAFKGYVALKTIKTPSFAALGESLIERIALP